LVVHLKPAYQPSPIKKKKKMHSKYSRLKKTRIQKRKQRFFKKYSRLKKTSIQIMIIEKKKKNNAVIN
jgi:hypothetical protein